MSQNPVLFPGAALSRNSVMRNSAVQASAYVAMDASLARPPVTFDELFAVNNGATTPILADRPCFSRLKFRDNSDYDCGTVVAMMGTPTSPPVTWGAAVYEYQPLDGGGFCLRFVTGAFKQMQLGYSYHAMRLPTPFRFDRKKAYALGLVADTNALSQSATATFNSVIRLPAGQLQYDAFYTTSYNVTSSSGWPSILVRPMQVLGTPNELIVSINMVLGIVVPNDFSTGLIY